MTALFLDARTGISGDMWLAGLCGLGWDPRELQQLAEQWLQTDLTVQQHKDSIAGWTVHIHDEQQPPHSLAEQKEHIARAPVREHVRRRAAGMLDTLIAAEAAIHGTQLHDVHLHELGKTDTLLDLVGVAHGLDRLDCQRVYCSAIELGGGTVETAHGTLPVPAPATAHLLRGLPVILAGLPGERTTPTGAVLAASLVDTFGTPPEMRLQAISYGCGERDYSPPSRLALYLFDDMPATADNHWMIETNIDDSEGRVLAYLCEQLLIAGARDAWLTPIVMKKSRAAVTLNVLTDAQLRPQLEALIFREVPTFGLRTYPVSRTCLADDHRSVSTPWGPARVRCGFLHGNLMHCTPEYEDCKTIAQKHDLALADVIARIRELARGPHGR